MKRVKRKQPKTLAKLYCKCSLCNNTIEAKATMTRHEFKVKCDCKPRNGFKHRGTKADLVKLFQSEGIPYGFDRIIWYDYPKTASIKIAKEACVHNPNLGDNDMERFWLEKDKDDKLRYGSCTVNIKFPVFERMTDFKAYCEKIINNIKEYYEK